ncbi:hypothetical protein H257_04416 [Aphanomyces astaci]|uniref:Uncharacterized protein n=1 Tax=Aphanomyces astaci TaxID=112090 RepID=W4GY03_APHAT|nr:hypothetical protein H257_04416 [Aphanomyces astaci]ETV83798.1 hypothetical protein H257_04416 [Aphanomyces astaci]|eukprot:XP_009827228.1 hypothetical protein H257_04416 [Aphanomyces astaci]
MHHQSEAVDAARQRERGWNASPNVPSKRVLLTHAQLDPRAAYRTMKKAEVRRLAAHPILHSKRQANCLNATGRQRRGVRVEPLPLELVPWNATTKMDSQRVVASRRPAPMDRHVVVQEREARVGRLARLVFLPIDHKLAWNTSNHVAS